MNPLRVRPEDYIDFLIATPDAATSAEAARVQPARPDGPAPDAFTRLLHRLEPDTETLWREARPQIDLAQGVQVLDDTVLDKPYARHIELVGRPWVGQAQARRPGDRPRVAGLDRRRPNRPLQLPRLPRRQGVHQERPLPRHDRRGPRARHRTARVLFDGWYASLENLKHLRAPGWGWLSRLKANRLVNKDRQGQRPLSRTDVSAAGTEVWLTGYGLVKVFKIVAPDGHIAYWASDDPTMTDLQR